MAQSNASFSPVDQFLIPSSNGVVNFAVNGSYSNATLENGLWAFKNLNINGSSPLKIFLVSAQNSNVTVFSFFSSNSTATLLRLRYAVQGNGKQTFNFGQGHINAVDWTIVKTVNRTNIFLTPGKDYTMSSNGTIVVNGATGNFSIVHYNFINDNLFNSNLPFYERHSVAIATSAVVAVVIVLAVVIAVRNRKYSEKNLSNSIQTKNSESLTLKDKEKT
jgi:FlaG/FlaF family flagellin (archaellin)